MPRGFYVILAAQFFSALGDNTLLFAAIALLRDMSVPEWGKAMLQLGFAVFYVALAPFVGAFADALPKGRVMFISNGIKLIGCLAMLAGVDPFLAYMAVGLGAAAYSPAKYGILTEYLPPQKLVAANGWMEGSTVLAIILGPVLCGILLDPRVFDALRLTTHIPFVDQAIGSAPRFAIALTAILYVVAALFNRYIPRLALDHKLPKKTIPYLLHDFWHCFKLLWRDPLGQVSLAVTTLFWGVGTVLKLVVLDWAQIALGLKFAQATMLTATVAVGIAIGSALAGWLVKLEKSVKVLPVGIAMGIVVLGMLPIHDWRLAGSILVIVGAMAGFFVVPMNALLQHRGHLLMGAGHSIAVQNFNENASILALNAAYGAMMGAGLSVHGITLLFGLFISSIMTLLYRKHRNDPYA
jgi:MFS transporter, LPLT family, lysophospholipid transporter